MKSMKLIMENFRKTMKEAQFGDPDFTPGPNPYFDYDKNKPKFSAKQDIAGEEGDKSPEEAAKTAAVEDIMRQYTELELHNMMYDELEDLFVNRFSDNHPEEALPEAEDIADKMLTVGVLNPEEQYDDELPSDQEEPPGYMPGEGGNY